MYQRTRPRRRARSIAQRGSDRAGQGTGRARRRDAAALPELYDAWQQVARSDPGLDEWLCENYLFDRDLLEVLVDGVDWARRIVEASRAHDNADNSDG